MDNYSDLMTDSNDSYECKNILGMDNFFLLNFITFINYSFLSDNFRRQTIKAYDIKSLLEERYAILSGIYFMNCFYFHCLIILFTFQVEEIFEVGQ